MPEEQTLRQAAEPCPPQTFTDFVQLGIVVKDLDHMVKVLSEVFGLGPFRYITYPPPGRDPVEMELTHRGQPESFSHRIAFAKLGPIELEIVEPLTGPSALTEFLEQHGDGIQHIRFNVPALQPVLDYLAGQGIQTLTSGGGIRPGTRWAHMDTEEQLGFVVEIMNVLPGTDGRTPLP